MAAATSIWCASCNLSSQTHKKQSYPILPSLHKHSLSTNLRRFPTTLNSAANSESPWPSILVSDKLGEAGLHLLRQFGHVECLYNLSSDELCSTIGEFDALVVRSGTMVTRRLFEAAKGRLKVVGRAGVGIDNVDRQAATEFGCLVVNAPTANTIAAAEHGIALLTAMARNVARADASMKAGMYRQDLKNCVVNLSCVFINVMMIGKWERSKNVGVSVVGKTLAVMGFGRVGSEVARRGKALGMRVIAHDPYAPADTAHAVGVDLVSFDEALSTAHFVSLHMPLTPSTRGLFDDRAFAKMAKGVRFINVARGCLVDEDALLRALDSGVVAQVLPLSPILTL